MCVICDLVGKAAANGGIIIGGTHVKEQRKLLVKRNEGKTTEEVRGMLKQNGFSLDRAVTILESPDAFIYIQDIETAKAAGVPAPAVPQVKPNTVDELRKTCAHALVDAAGSLKESSQWALIDAAMELLRAKVLKTGMESLTPIELLIEKFFVGWMKEAGESEKKS